LANKKQDSIEFNREAGMRKVTKPTGIPPWGWALAAAILAIGIFGSIIINKDLSTCPYEMDALYALRALGNVELAYRDFNIENRYATLDGLKQHGFVKYGFTDTKIARGYRVEIVPFSLHNDNVHSFVIRIFPLSKTRPCRIFQVGPDRKFKEFVPLMDSNPHRVENWIDATYIINQLPERDRLPWMGENYMYN
jgi:hypothetical protein